VGERLRPVDLARAAGISTQQVRNYVDAGVLPPAPRSESGYRQFTSWHLDALLTYRALAKGFGWDAAQAIMRAVHSSDLPLALSIVDASHAALHTQRLSLQAAGEALEKVAQENPEVSPSRRSDLRIGEVAHQLGVRPSALRIWEAAGLLTPRRERGTEYRRFSAADVRDARMIAMLRQGRYPLAQIQPILDGLRKTGSSDALRAAIAQRQAELTQRATAMLEAAGHLRDYALGRD
jgi:DNA-binding transcriptional MerR regulator